jgi:hypothetical protein
MTEQPARVWPFSDLNENDHQKLPLAPAPPDRPPPGSSFDGDASVAEMPG